MHTDKPHCPSGATDNPSYDSLDVSLLPCNSYFAFRRAIVERVLVHVHILQHMPGVCGAQAPLPIVEEATQFPVSLLCCQDIFYTLLFRSVLLGVPHSHTVLLWSFLSSLSLLSLLPTSHLRCCLQNPVLYHRPNSCVCPRARLNFREYTTCSNQNSFFSWTGLCSWMVSSFVIPRC